MSIAPGAEAAVAEDIDETAEVEQEETEAPDPAAEVEKWKAEARKHERRARQNAEARRELQQLQQGNQTDQERIAAEAKESGRKEAAVEFGQRLAEAEIRAALTGVVDNPADVIEDLNLSKYVTEDGEVDPDAVKALRTKYTKLLGTRRPPSMETAKGTGGRGSTSKTPADDFADTLNGLLNH